MNDKKLAIPELNTVFDGTTISNETNKEAELLQGLTRSLSQGDEQAWEQLYLLLYDSLAAFIKSIVRSKDEADDLAQEIFIKLWENFSRIDPSKNIRAYIFAMARGFSYNHLRDRIKKRGFASMDDMPEISLNDFSPDELIIADELRLIIGMALETMPEKRQSIFRLSRYEGKSSDEIAESLNISKRTVEHHLYLAVRELKELLHLAAVLLMVQGIVM